MPTSPPEGGSNGERGARRRISRKKALIFLPLGLAFATAVGCARSHPAAPEPDAEAKAMSAPSDKALVYVYRNEAFGGGIHLHVQIDGREMDITGPRSFMMFLVPPGRHLFTPVSETTSDVEVETAAGETYYMWQEVKLGILFARTKLWLTTEEEGKKGLRECDLVQHRPF
jgi:hypothetical protein